MLCLDLSLNEEETTLVLIKYFSPVCPSRIYDLRHSQSWNQSFLWVLEKHTVDNVENIIETNCRLQSKAGEPSEE